jgi:hypothetical protein
MPNRRLRQATLAVLCAPLLLASGCSPSDSPAHEGTRRAAQAVISDQLHNGGTEGFFFLPPMVPQSVGLTGDYVPTVNPTVRIDELDRRGGTIRTLATFLTIETYTARAPLSPPRRDDSDPEGYFFINWETANERLSVSGRYRVRVLVPTAGGGTRELGFADVDVVRNRQEFRSVDTVNFTPLINGSRAAHQVPHRPPRGGRRRRRRLRLASTTAPRTPTPTSATPTATAGRRLRVPRRDLQGHSRRVHASRASATPQRALLQPHRARWHPARSATPPRPARRRLRRSSLRAGLRQLQRPRAATAARPHQHPRHCGACGVACTAVAHSTPTAPPAPARSPATRAGPTPTATAPTAASSTSPPTPTAARPATPASPASGHTSTCVAAPAPPSRARPRPTATPRERRLRGLPRHRRRPLRRLQHACVVANATAACVAGACAVGTCNAGFADCDGDAANGCETTPADDVANCGACGHACALANATPVCAAGACAVGVLRRGLRRLQRRRGRRLRGRPRQRHQLRRVRQRLRPPHATPAAPRGPAPSAPAPRASPTATRRGLRDHLSSVTSCGGCGVVCATGPHATPTCGTGACGIAARPAGFADCDGVASNGCEVDTTLDGATAAPAERSAATPPPASRAPARRRCA